MEGDRSAPPNRHDSSIPCPPFGGRHSHGRTVRFARAGRADPKTRLRWFRNPSMLECRAASEGFRINCKAPSPARPVSSKLESCCRARHSRCAWHHPSYNRSTFASPRGRFLTGLGPLVESRVTRFSVSQLRRFFGRSIRIRPGQGRREMLAFVVGSLEKWFQSPLPGRFAWTPVEVRVPATGF